jgi:hypothetical protein
VENPVEEEGLKESPMSQGFPQVQQMSKILRPRKHKEIEDLSDDEFKLRYYLNDFNLYTELSQIRKRKRGTTKDQTKKT